MPDPQPATLRWLEGLVTGDQTPDEPARRFADLFRQLDTPSDADTDDQHR